MATYSTHKRLKEAISKFDARDLPVTMAITNELLAKKEHLKKDVWDYTVFLKAKAYQTRGIYQNRKEDLQDALIWFQILDEEGNIDKVDLHTAIIENHLAMQDPVKAYEIIKDYEDSIEEYDAISKVKILVICSKYYEHINNIEKSLAAILEAKKLLTDDSEHELIAKCYDQLIVLFIKTNQFAKISEYAPRVLDYSHALQNMEIRVKALNALAISNAIKGDYKKAFELLIEAKEQSEAIGFDKNVAKCLTNLGNIYSSLYNYDEAIKYLLKVIEKYKHVVDGYTLGIIYFNLGGGFFVKEDDLQAMRYFEKALQIAKEVEFYRLEGRSLYEIGRIYLRQDNIEEALVYLKKAEKLHQLRSIRHGQEVSFVNLGVVYFRQEKYEKALQYTLEGIEICKKVRNNKTLIRGYRTLADIYKAMGNFEKALENLELYTTLQESTSKEMRQKQLIDMEIRYETKEKEKEIELLKSKMAIQELELQHQKEIEEQNILLRNANDDLFQFTYAVSHDLKEPIRMIGSFAKLIHRQLNDHIDEDTQQFFDYVIGGADRMNKLVHGLLEYAKIGANQEDFVEIETNDVITDVLENLYFAIQDSNATINYDKLPAFTTHRVLFTQLMQNIISNAIKFKKPEEDAVVDITYAEDETSYTFIIADNGIGIADEHLDTIFKIFKRLHKKEEYEGTGLGLSVCKKIVNHLRGDIWLNSSVGEGTTFFIRLPKAIDIPIQSA